MIYIFLLLAIYRVFYDIFLIIRWWRGYNRGKKLTVSIEYRTRYVNYVLLKRTCIWWIKDVSTPIGHAIELCVSNTNSYTITTCIILIKYTILIARRPERAPYRCTWKYIILCTWILCCNLCIYITKVCR